MYGRGTLDDKGAAIAILEAVQHLLRAGYHPTRTIHLAFGEDEEIGGARGAEEVVKLLRSRGVAEPALVLDEGARPFRGPGMPSPADPERRPDVTAVGDVAEREHRMPLCA